MLATALYILAIGSRIGCDPQEPITLREFSLATTNGDNVFHEEFDRRRLADASHRLALKFHAFEKQFEFEFVRNSVFAPNGVVRMTGHVREHFQFVLSTDFFKPTIHVVQSKGQRLCGSTAVQHYVIFQSSQRRHDHFHQRYCRQWRGVSAQQSVWHSCLRKFALGMAEHYTHSSTWHGTANHCFLTLLYIQLQSYVIVATPGGSWQHKLQRSFLWRRSSWPRATRDTRAAFIACQYSEVGSFYWKQQYRVLASAVTKNSLGG